MNIGKKAIAVLVISAFFFGVTTASATAAKTFDVRKVVENADNIKVGEEVAILLQFKNPFKQAIPLQIVDRNVFGNNGLDIKCLEYTLPANEESVIAYSEPIVPFKPGKYTLDAAKVTYTNPETGKHETVESNTLDIEVKANNSLPPGQQEQAQGITTIYQCNGTNIHSTSYSSSGSSFNIQIGRSSHSSSYGNEQQQSGGQQQESVEKRVTNNQISQNIGQLKKELEKEMQQQSGNPWWLLLLIPLAGVVATGWFIFDKYLKKTRREEILPQPLTVESGLSVDHVGEARRMIEEAENLFRNDREKDAYEKISKAIRFYFSYKLDIKRELLNSELMNALKGKADADTCSKIKECLDLCGMVEFAKYKSNQNDFGKIVEMAKGVIV